MSIPVRTCTKYCEMFLNLESSIPTTASLQLLTQLDDSLTRHILRVRRAKIENINNQQNPF